MRPYKLLLLLIILLAFVLRLYKLTSFPPHLYWDEAAIGYNAYSISQTGKDEYGNYFPLSFESFQDSKNPGYIYIVALLQLFLGPTSLSVRLPSAIFGVLSVVIIYAVVRELITKENRLSKISALLSALLFAISPWSLQFSRVGFEANGGLLVALLAIYLLIKWLKTGKYLILCATLIILSFYFYYQQRLFFLLFLPAILLLNIKILPKLKKKSIVAVLLLFIICSTPIIKDMISNSGRLAYVSILKNQEILKDEVQKRFIDNNNFQGRLAHNYYFIMFSKFLEGYFSHFSADFLFFKGESNPRHSVSGMGELYIFYIPFLIIGLLKLWEREPLYKKIIILWLLISPLAAALSLPSPHALRSLLLAPAFDILISLGIALCFVFLIKSKKIYKSLFKLVLICLLFFFVFRYLHLYYIHEKDKSSSWADGHEQLFSYLMENESDYDQIYVTGKYWRPYIFMLFYNRYSPELQHLNPSNSQIGKYYFGYASFDSSNPRYNYQQLSLDKLRNTPKTLLALAPDEKRNDDKIINIIYSVNHQPVFLIISTDD